MKEIQFVTSISFWNGSLFNTLIPDEPIDDKADETQGLVPVAGKKNRNHIDYFTRMFLNLSELTIIFTCNKSCTFYRVWKLATIPVPNFSSNHSLRGIYSLFSLLCIWKPIRTSHLSSSRATACDNLALSRDTFLSFRFNLRETAGRCRYRPLLTFLFKRNVNKLICTLHWFGVVIHIQFAHGAQHDSKDDIFMEWFSL